MKKVIFLVLLCSMLLSIVSCSNNLKTDATIGGNLNTAGDTITVGQWSTTVNSIEEVKKMFDDFLVETIDADNVKVSMKSYSYSYIEDVDGYKDRVFDENEGTYYYKWQDGDKYYIGEYSDNRGKYKLYGEGREFFEAYGTSYEGWLRNHPIGYIDKGSIVSGRIDGCNKIEDGKIIKEEFLKITIDYRDTLKTIKAKSENGLIEYITATYTTFDGNSGYYDQYVYFSIFFEYENAIVDIPFDY